jgi:hypothetical protein
MFNKKRCVSVSYVWPDPDPQHWMYALTFLDGVLPEHLPDVGGASVQGLAVDLLDVHLHLIKHSYYINRRIIFSAMFDAFWREIRIWSKILNLDPAKWMDPDTQTGYKIICFTSVTGSSLI